MPVQKAVHKIIDWLLYTSLFAACCSVGLSMATEKLILGVAPQAFSYLHLLVFSSTLLVYNTHYIIKKSTPELSDRFGWSQHHKLWHRLFLAVGVLGCGISVLHMPQEILEACVILGILSFSYSIPLLPFKDKKRLKDFGWIKILVLTTVWTIVTSVLPILYLNERIDNYPFEILIRFVFMFTLCAAFDIRDMQTDMESGIATLPNLIGEKWTYKLMSAAMILFILMSVIQFSRHPSLGRLAAELVVAVMTKIVIDYSRKHPSDRAYLGLVDGMMLLYAILVLLHRPT